MILIPVFVFAFLFDPSVTQSLKDWLCFLIYVAAGITDWLDGYIARKDNLVTDFGKLMDPLADKLLNAAALICFTSIGILSPVVAIIIISSSLSYLFLNDCDPFSLYWFSALLC